MGSVSGFSLARSSHQGGLGGMAWEISHELLPASVLQAGGSAEAKPALALTSLNPIFSSQQQQEALPDETEVVEETVAEVSEVGGWWPRPSLFHVLSLWNPDGLCGSPAGSGHLSPMCTQHRWKPYTSYNLSRVLPKPSVEPCRGGAIILKAFISEAVGPFFLDDHEVSPYIQPSKGELPVLLAGVEGLALPLALTPRWPRKPLDRIQGTASTVGR